MSDRLPVVRVDNELLFPGGYSRRMMWRERIAWHFGRRLVSTQRAYEPWKVWP